MTYTEKEIKIKNKIRDISCDICKYVWKCDGEQNCRWKNEIEAYMEDEDEN